jgi:hypothetical protein
MKGLEIEEKERKTESLRILRHQFSDVAGKSPSPIGWESTHVQPVPEAVICHFVSVIYINLIYCWLIRRVINLLGGLVEQMKEI